MGNTPSCCCSRPNTNANSHPVEHSSQSTLPSQSNQPIDTPQSSSAPSIDSILSSIPEENTTERREELINMLARGRSKIKDEGEESSTSSGVEHVASNTRFASQVVDFFSKEADNLSKLEEMAGAAKSLLDVIGRTHYIFVGLSLVAYTLDTYLKKKSNDDACNDLLEELIDLAMEVKTFNEAVPGKSMKVKKAIQDIVAGVTTCCAYIDRGSAYRYWAASVEESHLQKTKEMIRDRRDSLNLTATTYIADRVGQIPQRSVPSPSELLDFQPDGIEDQVEDVKNLLDVGGSEQAIAVVIVGFGGIGKSTLAASAIESLNLSSTDFKFSMVSIDEKTPDKKSHIVKLQSLIIFHFTGNFVDLQDTQQGRQKLQAAMARKSCFLYIDNAVDSSYITELLPKKLLPEYPSEEKSESESSAENSQKQMRKTTIRILITSRQNDLKPVLNIKSFVHDFRMIQDKTSEELLKRTILQGKPAQDFEHSMINKLAKACGNVPLLLSTFGSHLKDNRKERNYEEAIQALNEGNIDRYSVGAEELLSEKLMFVYDQMRDVEAQEAFLDICTYFQGWQWDAVEDIVDSTTLAILQDKKLVNRSETSTVIVHDILRLMGARKAKDTRVNYEEFFNINDDKSKLKNIKGMHLRSPTSLITLETRQLNAMRHSLRVLILGDWIRLEGPPCDKSFVNLRYLQVEDLKDFPFKDISKMKNLNAFWNGSKPGMDLAQLPPSLKRLLHRIPYRDCNEFARLPLQNLKYLKEFHVETKRSVRLPQGLKFPASLQLLELTSCEQLLPETFGHLSALRSMYLDKCDLKCLPQGFTQSTQLTYLGLQHCTNMTSLRDNTFAALCLLRELDLTGCIRLEELPADLGTLTALQYLNIQECQNLRSLPENFGGLQSLKILVLDGCVSLQRLPDSFGMLRIEYLTLKSLAIMKELPQSIGDLSFLKELILESLHSLESVPDNFVQLPKLNTLVVEDCIKLGALPKNFEQLLCLEKIYLWECPLLTGLPDGFQALKTLKLMSLGNCRRLVNLPSCFDMLSCLEELYLEGLLFSTVPDGLGKLTKLKTLSMHRCNEVKTLPQDFQNLTILKLRLTKCRMLEGTTMDKIVNLQNSHHVYIRGSTKLIERWNELKEENKNLPVIIQTSSHLDPEELDRARRVGLLCGECIELHSTTKEFIHHSSLSIPNNTTIAVISLQLDQSKLFQSTVDMAMERATSNCAGQLRIIYVCSRTDGSDAPNEEDEMGKIRQALTMLPHGISYAIPSTDMRRLSLIGRTIFNNPDVFSDGTDTKRLCSMLDFMEDDEGHQIFKDGDRKHEEIEHSNKKNEISDGIVEFINCICESKTQSPSGQCSRLPQENMDGEFIQKLKNNNIDHFSNEKVKVDHLQGKEVAIILIDQDSPECIRLQQIYHDIKLKHSNFEAIWIPLPEEEDFGFGTYSRAIQRMPWLTLADPKLIKIQGIKDKSPRVIMINSGGNIGNPNALSLLMSWGGDAYPFTEGSLSQLDLKSSLELLFHSTEIKEVNKKVIFLYAEPPSRKLEMKGTLEKLVRMHGKGNFEIVYVGRFFAEREGATQNLHKAYEDATESMNWTKLPFDDMMTFWYRLQCLSDEAVHESTLKRVVEALLDEGRWLVVVDGDGMVTGNGMDVVEMACESSDEVEMMMGEELRESLKEGKCSERVRAFFRDELNHPLHPHPLRTCKRRAEGFYCNRCGLRCVHEPYGQRRLRCDDCDWDLCCDCWKEFVKEEVTRHATQD